MRECGQLGPHIDMHRSANIQAVSSREARLVGEAKSLHVVEHINNITTVAATTHAIVRPAVEQCLAAKHGVRSPALLPDLETILQWSKPQVSALTLAALAICIGCHS